MPIEPHIYIYSDTDRNHTANYQVHANKCRCEAQYARRHPSVSLNRTLYEPASTSIYSFGKENAFVMENLENYFYIHVYIWV